MAIQLHDVDHRYGRRRSLYRVCLTVQRGDCYGFIGHNGAGKTTTLRIILGLDAPAGGSIHVDGFDVRRTPREVRARTGGTIEATGFYPWSSGLDNLVALARLQGMGRGTARAEAGRWLDEVGLTEHGERRVGAYSQGMRQRLGLAQALLGSPPYVLLDEPHNGLDPEGLADLRALLRRLTAEHGMTVLLSSHQLQEVAGLCNRIGVLREGRMLLEQDTATLLASTRHRHLLRTDDAEATGRVLAGLEVVRHRGDDGWIVELAATPAADLVRRLVAVGIGVEQISPRPATLEEIYLRLSSGDEQGSPPTPTAAVAPGETRRAMSRPALRMAAFDLRRQLPRWPFLVALVVPVLVVWRRIHEIWSDNQGYLEQVRAGRLQDAAELTGFDGIGHGLAQALPVVAVLGTALASQSVAGDLTLGTLRNILLRPLRRAQVVLGKWLAVAASMLAMTAVTYAASFGLSASYFGFADKYELTRTGARLPIRTAAAADLWPLLGNALASSLLPLLACATVGLLVGAVVRRAVWALGLALAAVILLDFGRMLARPLGVEAWLPSTHMPSPFSDRSYLLYFIDRAAGADDAWYRFDAEPWIAPLSWVIVPFALSALAMSRKRIP